jgi:hypothetical protein
MTPPASTIILANVKRLKGFVEHETVLTGEPPSRTRREDEQA